MRNNIFTYMLIISFGYVGTAQTNEKIKSCSELTYSDLGFVQLADKDESGEKLIIYGRVIDAISGQTIKNANLFFYQAGNDGNYNSSFIGMPSFARIRGKVKTNADGCFKIKTIVPGNYPGQIDGKHIHVIAKAKGYEKWMFEFLFEGWISENLRKEIQQNNDAIILELGEKDSGSWVVQTKIKLKQK